MAILFAVIAGCGSSGDDDQQPGSSSVEGVSSEDMVGQAAPMTLEEAESLGIVDTTVRVAPPVGPDSLPVYNPSPLSGDSLR